MSAAPLVLALRARARLALWERRPDALLALLPEPQRVIFASQEAYEPALLYAAWAHQLRGDSAAARRAFGGALGQLDSLLLILPGDGRLQVSRGLAMAGLGRRADAQREAERLRLDPRWDPIRHDPRFQALVRRYGG